MADKMPPTTSERVVMLKNLDAIKDSNCYILHDVQTDDSLEIYYRERLEAVQRR